MDNTNLCKKIETKDVIFKSNMLIESSYYLTLSEQRLIYLGAKKLKPLFINTNATPTQIHNMMMANIFDLVEITVPEFKKEFGIKSNTLYEDLKDITEKLFSRYLKICDEKGNITKKRWVITCKYDEERKSVFLQFHPDLVMHLLIFKDNFTSLQFQLSRYIKSSYGYRIYELLRQYLNVGRRIFTVEELRYILDINDNEYPQYGNFKQRILNSSLKVINKYSDINVEMDEIKEKRKVVKIVFKITKNKKNIIQNNSVQIQIPETTMDTNELSAFYTLKKILKSTEISPFEANKIFDAALSGIDTFNLDMSCFDYIKYEKKVIDNWTQEKGVNNYIGALINALKQNWKINKKKSAFCDYEQRQYTSEQIERIEAKLNSWE